MSETVGEALAAMRRATSPQWPILSHTQLNELIQSWADRLEAAMKTAPERVREGVGPYPEVPRVWLATLRAELGLGEGA